MTNTPRWPQHLLLGSAFVMAALTAFAARVLFGPHPETEGGGLLFAMANFLDARRRQRRTTRVQTESD